MVVFSVDSRPSEGLYGKESLCLFFWRRVDLLVDCERSRKDEKERAIYLWRTWPYEGGPTAAVLMGHHAGMSAPLSGVFSTSTKLLLDHNVWSSRLAEPVPYARITAMPDVVCLYFTF